MRRCAGWVLMLAAALPAPQARAQSVNAARLAILLAEQRRAESPADLALLRLNARSRDAETARLAVRALGRLERPTLIPSILPALDHPAPAVRAEAANALAQAASGLHRGMSGSVSGSWLDALVDRLADEPDAEVRASLAEGIGRLPYRDAAAAASARAALLALARSPDAVLTDRLAVAKGLEASSRIHQDHPLDGAVLDLLRALVRGAVRAPDADAGAGGGDSPPAVRAELAPQRSARVRRLALAALVNADALDADTVAAVAADPDAQVRRAAMRGSRLADLRPHLDRGLADPAPMVRIEALRSLPRAIGAESCPSLLAATDDGDRHVVLQAIDELSICGDDEAAVEHLIQLAQEHPDRRFDTGWHRRAHAAVALAAAAPERVRPFIARDREAELPALRMYAARAAALVGDEITLGRLAGDDDDNVAEAALDGLARVAPGRAADRFVAALSRGGYQVIRAAARGLAAAEPAPQVVAALQAALDRLVSENHQNSVDARAALTETLNAMGAPSVPVKPKGKTAPPGPPSPLSLAELRRLASPRARLSIRGVGTFDLALITREAPATVLHFVRLAEEGYYNGLTFHRVVPNFVIQGGSPAANEYVGHRDHMRDEVGLWPHVRGAVGISTRGRDTGDAQIFIDLVDNPRLDHEYTVFAYVVAGMDVVDRIREGDIIDRIEVLDVR